MVFGAVFLEFHNSCLCLKRDLKLDNIFVGHFDASKAKTIEILNEFAVPHREFHYSENSNFKKFEKDIANVIFFARELFNRHTIPLPVSVHLLWHVGDRLIRYERAAVHGLGLLNCSAFEQVHQEFNKSIQGIISNDKESYPYRDQLKSQLNIFNNKFMMLDEEARNQLFYQSKNTA